MYDDQGQTRIRLETLAKLELQEHIKVGEALAVLENWYEN
jgi:hypothetical protein